MSKLMRYLTTNCRFGFRSRNAVILRENCINVFFKDRSPSSRTFCLTIHVNLTHCLKYFDSKTNSSRSFCSGKVDTMVKILNVAEKNDAAKNLADIMSKGRYQRREGFSKFNKIYEFDYFILNRNHRMIMTSVSGHLLNLEFVGAYRNWQGCNPAALFDAPVAMFCPEDYSQIKRTLEREIKSCNILIIWTDCDREGENIGFEIIDVCKKVKSNIEVHRAKFSEITQQAVEQACRNLIPPDSRQNAAVQVRRELDLRIGAAFTRFQTLRLCKIFPDSLGQQLISYGSCQFPTLGFVVERYRQVQNFIPEPFWKIKVGHTKNKIDAEFSWKRNRLFDHTACFVLYERCMEAPTATVRDVRSKQKSKWRPQPMDTVALEKLCVRKLKLTAKEAMKIAEKLYTQGYISYPRTETTKFPPDLNLTNLVEQQTADSNWGAFASRVLQDGPNPRQGNKTDNAHPPIHPTKYTNSLQGNEKRLYELVVRHFLACVSKDAEGQETTIDIEVNEERFSLNGLVIIARNYLDVYPYENWNAKEVPEYHIGETFMPSSILMVDGETSPPPLLTEADLIALMEKHGIGTDATHADHIETIKSRLYVGLTGDGHFIPGELGMGLVEGYDLMGFEMSKPHLRAALEADLKRICEGAKDPKAVLDEQVKNYKEIFIKSAEQVRRLDEALSKYLGPAQEYVPNENSANTTTENNVFMKCSKCGSGDIVVKSTKDGKKFYLGCMCFPHCKAAIWFPECVVDLSITSDICDGCNTPKINFKFRRGSLAPHLPNEYMSCVGGCDSILMSALDIQPLTAGSSMHGTSSGPGVDSGFGSNFASSFNSNSTRSITSSSNNGGSASNNRRNAQSNVLPSSTLTSHDNNLPRTNGTPRNFHQPTGRLPLRSTSSDMEIVCNCGNAAVLLTVKKEGPNVGRQFYKCSKPTSQACNFFHWADAPLLTSSGNDASDPGPSTSRGRNLNLADDDTCCSCNQPAKLLTVQKDGPNKGRQFYGCAKPREQQCGFFLWADDASGRSGPAQTKRPAKERQGPAKMRTTSTSSRGKRKCGICGQEGHTRKTCPNGT